MLVAFLAGVFSSIIEKVNNCGSYIGMGINYGYGGSECESYLSHRYGLSLLSQSSDLPIDILLLPAIVYIIITICINLLLSLLHYTDVPFRRFFTIANFLVLYSSYCLSMVVL